VDELENTLSKQLDALCGVADASQYAALSPMISTENLAAALALQNNIETQNANAHLRIIDASYRLPRQDDPSAYDQFKDRHIIGAVFFNLDEIATPHSTLSHMAPSPQIFSDFMSDIGIKSNDIIIIYDDYGLFSAPRAWWTFKTMGHKHCFILDGGLPKWLSEKRPVTGAISAYEKSSYKPNLETEPASNQNNRPSRFCNSDRVQQVINAIDTQTKNSNDVMIIDMRPQARFFGKQSEPRKNLRSGHMPEAKNLPFSHFLNPDGTLKDDQKLRQLLEEIGLTDDISMIATCGSGITAAFACLVREKLGCTANSLYDGSWAEWGNPDHDPDLFPVLPKKENLK